MFCVKQNFNSGQDLYWNLIYENLMLLWDYYNSMELFKCQYIKQTKVYVFQYNLLVLLVLLYLHLRAYLYPK